MNLRSFDITAEPTRRFAGFVEILCPFRGVHLESLIRALPAESEIFVCDPDDVDCRREVRRTDRGLETKRGRQGKYGSWKAATLAQCVEWISVSADADARTSDGRIGSGLVIPEVEYEG